jgi:hypothetical protein
MAVAKASTPSVAEIVESLVGSKVAGEQFNGGSGWSSSYIVRTEGRLTRSLTDGACTTATESLRCLATC